MYEFILYQSDTGGILLHPLVYLGYTDAGKNFEYNYNLLLFACVVVESGFAVSKVASCSDNCLMTSCAG